MFLADGIRQSAPLLRNRILSEILQSSPPRLLNAYRKVLFLLDKRLSRTW